VAASGTNLASIGYHFGSKDGLLFAAISEAIEDWAAELGRMLAKTEIDEGATLAERLDKVVDGLVEAVVTHRALWVAAFEFVPQVVREPELREQVAEACAGGRTRLAELLLGAREVTEEDERTVGGLFFVLLSGLITQWLVDPHRAPDAGELLQGMRSALAAS
jgi:AcrR family transcriptional regulator